MKEMVLSYFSRHRGDTNLAIRSFNVARLGKEFEVEALCAMVENCLSLALQRISPSFSYSSHTSNVTTTSAYVDGEVHSSRLPLTTTSTAIVDHNEEVSTIGFRDASATAQASGDVEAVDVESVGYETAALLLVVSIKAFRHTDNMSIAYYCDLSSTIISSLYKLSLYPTFSQKCITSEFKENHKVHFW